MQLTADVAALLADPVTVPFALGLFAAAGVYAILLVTLLTDYRLWPPGERNAAFYAHWLCVGVVDVALVVTAVGDWNAWLLPRPASLVAGLVLTVVGTAVYLRSTGVMESEETMGVTGDLYTDGPYAYSRTPQYVGMAVGLPGLALGANSALVAGLVAAHVGWVLLLPFAEEPHLRAVFGAEYECYCERVPRFVGLRTLRALSGDQDESPVL